jgi:hypothetical protein
MRAGKMRAFQTPGCRTHQRTREPTPEPVLTRVAKKMRGGTPVSWMMPVRIRGCPTKILPIPVVRTEAQTPESLQTRALPAMQGKTPA